MAKKKNVERIEHPLPRTKKADLAEKKAWLKSEYPRDWKKIWVREHLSATAVAYPKKKSKRG